MPTKRQELVVEITADADKAAQEITRLAKAAKPLEDGVKVPVDVTGTDATKAKLNDVDRAADGAKNTFANLVGNTAQDLGSLGGPLGSVGVAIGQLAEYTTDAAQGGQGLTAALKGAAGMVGPLAGLSLATLAVTNAVERWQKRQAELKAIHEETTAAFLESTAVVERWGETLDEAFSTGTADRVQSMGKVLSDRLKPEELNRIAVAFGKMGLSMEDLGEVIPQADADFRAFAASLLESAGATDEQARAMAKFIDETEHMGDISKFANFADMFDAMGPEQAERLKRMASGLGELADQAQNVDLQKVAKDALDAARAFDAAGVAAAEAGGGLPLEQYQRYTDAQQAAKRAAEEQARAAEEGARAAAESGTVLDQVGRQVEEASQAAADAMDRARRAQDAWLLGTVDAQAEVDDVSSAILRYADVVGKRAEAEEKGTLTTKDQIESDIALRDAMAAITREGVDVVNSYKDQGLTADQARAKQAELAQQQYDLAIAMGFPEAAAQAIKDQLLAIPPSVPSEVEVTAKNLAETEKRLDDLEKDRNATVYINGILDRGLADFIRSTNFGAAGQSAPSGAVGLSAAPTALGAPIAPSAAPMAARDATITLRPAINVNVSAGVVADTFQLQRVVERAVRSGARLGGRR